MDSLIQLATLLNQRNAIDEKIAKLIDRPASTGHIGEYIASLVFDIRLAVSATNKHSDGHFMQGHLEGKTVNIKFYGKQESSLDFPTFTGTPPITLPDYYLVLTGVKSAAMSSRGTHRPLTIESVFLFQSKKLIEALNARSQRSGRTMKFGVATSVPAEFWQSAEIYPRSVNQEIILTPQQQQLLALFR